MEVVWAQWDGVVDFRRCGLLLLGGHWWCWFLSGGLWCCSGSGVIGWKGAVVGVGCLVAVAGDVGRWLLGWGLAGWFGGVCSSFFSLRLVVLSLFVLGGAEYL